MFFCDEREGGDGGNGPWFVYVFCVCGETAKNKCGPKKSQHVLEHIDHVMLVILEIADKVT
jgi:hypothetical protein